MSSVKQLLSQDQKTKQNFVPAMDFDKVLEEIGEFGLYQKTNYLLICLPVMFAAANSLSYVFTAGVPNYRCAIPECEQTPKAIYDEKWMSNAVPGRYNTNGTFIPEQCYKYKIKPSINTSSFTDKCPSDMFLKDEKIKCTNWVYDDYEVTLVNAWDITCSENAWKLALVGTTHFAGLVVGTFTSGFLADKFGRKLIFVISIIFMALTGVFQGLAWDYNSFIVFDFLNAIGTAAVYPLAFIIGVEMVGPTKREMSVIVLNYFYAIGEASVGLIAWLCRDWRMLQYVLSAPSLLFVFYYWFVPESVRWLIAKDDHKRAGKIIKKAARINQKELSDALLKSFKLRKVSTESESPAENQENSKDIKNVEVNCTEIYSVVLDVLRSKILVGRFTILLYVWAVNAFVFYGLSLNSTSLSGNKYLNFALVCLVEIPGYTMAWIALRKFGRRWSLSGSLFLCSFTCVAGGFIEEVLVAKDESLSWAIVLLFLIGKLGITSSFAVIYAYTAEMTPTIIRSGGVGCMSTVARFGSMAAPFVPLLGVYYTPLPLLLFGGVSLTAGLVSLLLPETFRQKLPDTVQEAENIGR